MKKSSLHSVLNPENPDNLAEMKLPHKMSHSERNEMFKQQNIIFVYLLDIIIVFLCYKDIDFHVKFGLI